MSKRIEIILVTLLLAISFFAHYHNMFHFPYYENDEGTYMSQAWSLIKTGKLAPYTYWYDHAPAGWILIAGWVQLTGGIFAFGTSVNSGRVLMLVLHLFSSLLLYLIARKLTKSTIAGAIAVLIFSLSPLGIYFQRRVLLDNMMTFWVLLSLYIILRKGRRLFQVILSAIAFGIAILTKENAIFFIPAFVYILYSNSNKHQRAFLVAKWLAVMAFVTSSYFLYAFLKGELFPVGFMGSGNHVSLLTTLHDQFIRGRALPFWDKSSEFYTNLINWLVRDPFTVINGSLATLLCLVLGIFNKKLRIQGYLAALFWLFLLRGKLVIEFYITPAVPLMALCIGSLVALGIERVSRNIDWLKAFLTSISIVLIIALLVSPTSIQYTKDETSNQIAAIKWIKQNLSPNTTMLIDDAIYVDLHDQRYPGDKVFPNADWSWKVEKDPEISKGKLNGDWANITYIIVSHEILKQIKDSSFPFVKKAFDNSYLVKSWTEGSNSYIDASKYISTNGDWMAVYKIKDKDKIVIDKSWQYYKDNYLKSYGQIIDPQTNNTTSEGQSYALLRSVWQGDEETFTGVWKWTKDHLQHRIQDKLLSWLWLNADGSGKIGDSEAATDADEDTALALLFAYKKWGNKQYLLDAKQLINAIWENEVVKVDKHYYLISGPGANREKSFLINPSYYSPASYRIFASVDSDHDWLKLADDSYYLLNNLASQSGNTTHLPPNWILLDGVTGDIQTPEKYISDINATAYGFDAFRATWRVALDKLWFDSPSSTAYLEKLAPFYLANSNKMFAIYSLDGSARVTYESLSTWTANYFAQSTINDSQANQVFNTKINSSFNIDNGYWGDKNNYYDQNWAWFASAWHSHDIVNLWD